MKKPISSLSTKRKFYCLYFLFVSILLYALQGLSGQEYSTITGRLADQINNDPVPYANIGLYRADDSKLIHGFISDTSGSFVISNIYSGKYILKISMLGYDQISKEINIPISTRYDAGIILMNQNSINIGETIVVAERLKGRAEKDKTAYFITGSMAESSNNGLDIIKLIPGVQVDFMRNISLDGSQNILVLVDGKERDKNFVSQINPDNIEKVEILNATSSGYDADVTGVINIILKKEKKPGISGQINLEIPTESSLYYIHPDYNFSFGFKKLNIYTSYNGELIHFDQHESILRKIRINEETIETRSDQFVRQKLWSHRFHYGFDYAFTPKTQINFYAFYNPYSQEYDGIAKANTNNDNSSPWQALRETSDINRSTFYSLYFKHIFNDKGGEFTLDASNYHFLGKNVAVYSPQSSDGFYMFRNCREPIQNAASIKIDSKVPLGQNTDISMGAKVRMYDMQDRNVTGFRYSGKIYSVYSTLNYTRSDYDWNLGLRIEKSYSELRKGFNKHHLNVLPYVALSYKISTDKNVKIVLSSSVYRPNIYQLIPNLAIDDPYTMRTGNPTLDPEIRTAIFVEYSRKFKSNFGSVRIFYNRIRNTINSLTFLNDTSVFETRIYNLGTIHQSGFQLTGTLKACRIITFIPYLRFYGQFNDGNRLAGEYSILNRKQIVVESGFSSILSLKHDINLSVNVQYATPKNYIYGNTFCDPLYFISLDKTFKKRLKVGITSFLPFTGTITYQGSENKSSDFYYRNKGEIQLSKVPLWFKLSYQFNPGRKKEAMDHTGEEIDAVPKNGF